MAALKTMKALTGETEGPEDGPVLHLTVRSSVAELLERMDEESREELEALNITCVADLDCVAVEILRFTMRHRDREVYVDTLERLNRKYPAFPKTKEAALPCTLKRSAIIYLQREFERALQTGGQELLDVCGVAATLFLRGHLAYRALQELFDQLVGFGDVPKEHHILCACELYHVVYERLSQSRFGRPIVASLIKRFRKLRKSAALSAEVKKNLLEIL